MDSTKDLLDRFPQFQRKYLNVGFLNMAFGISSSKEESIKEMKRLAEREARERGVDYKDVLADIFRYYRKVNGHSLEYGRK